MRNHNKRSACKTQEKREREGQVERDREWQVERDRERQVEGVGQRQYVEAGTEWEGDEREETGR